MGRREFQQNQESEQENVLIEGAVRTLPVEGQRLLRDSDSRGANSLDKPVSNGPDSREPSCVSHSSQLRSYLHLNLPLSVAWHLSPL